MGSKKEREDIFWLSASSVRPLKKSGAGPRLRHYAADTIRAIRGQSALILAASRDSLRETVFLWSTPLVIARCSSGCANRRADCAVALSPVEIAVSTFLTKVRTRLTRARLIAVRFAVCRMRFSADL